MVPTPEKGDMTQSQHLAFERLLGDLSASFADLPSDRVVDEISSALNRLIEFLGYDRCTFAEFADETNKFDILCSVARAGFQPTTPGTLPPLPWYFSELAAGRIVLLGSIPKHLPDQAIAEAEYCRRIGLKSNLGIPLRVGGKVVAAIAFTAFQRTHDWSEEVITRLKIVGEVFAQALARSRREAKLAEALAEIVDLKDRLESENSYLRESVNASSFRELKSRSPRFRRLLEEISQVAPTDSSVLLLGETGTGKEVLADAVHGMSRRSQRAMVKVNCAALPATLIEAELFGREKGAYTGALARQIGRFELAHSSTLFLDEVGELPSDLQIKLLRVLQDGCFERVGSTKTIRVDVRVISATNCDLAAAVCTGRFREDLYYRLNVFPITVPPLRDRPEDIPLLAWEFVREFSKSMGRPIERISDETMDSLLGYPWPGNVRELRNLIERAMILTSGSTLQVAPGLLPVVPPVEAAASTLDAMTRAHILRVLEQTRWRIRGSGGAAEILGTKPTTLESRMKKLGIQRPGSVIP